MKTERETRAAGSARADLTESQAIDQLGRALEQATAVLNLLTNDCFDGEPFSGDESNAELVLALAHSLLEQALDALEALQLVFASEAGQDFVIRMLQLSALVTLLQHNVGNTPVVQVFIALALAQNLAFQAKDDASKHWGAYRAEHKARQGASHE